MRYTFKGGATEKMTMNEAEQNRENGACGNGSPGSGSWKERIRRRIDGWIDSLPEDIEKTAAVPTGLPDLYSFFSALQALQAETRTSSRKTAESLARFGEILELTARRPLPAEKCAKEYVLPVLALFDRVARIRERMGKPPPARKLFPDRRWSVFHAEVSRAMDLLSDHIRSLMDAMELQRIPAAGERFDPRRMTAVEVVERADLPDNQVVEEIAAGYVRGDAVVRLAEVRVSRDR
jgi:hypothetical protein